MNPAILLGLVRHVLTLVGGVLVSRGSLDPTQAETLIGAILSIVGVVWSVLQKRQAALTPTERPTP
jgi:hypothetical protein